MPDDKDKGGGAPPSDFKQLGERLEAIGKAQIPKDDFERMTKVVAETQVAVAELQKLVVDRSASLGAEDDGKQYSFSRVMLALDEGRGPKDWKDIAPYEFEVSEATRTYTRKKIAEGARSLGQGDQARATLNTLVDNEGGFLVPTEKLTSFYDIFWKVLVLTVLGVTKLTSNAGEIQIPKATGSVTAYDIFEGKITGLSQSNPTFALMTMRPHELGVVTTYTKRLLSMATPSIDAFIEEQMARRAAEHMEDRLLNGTGANGQPRGLLYGSGAAAGNNIHLQGTLQHITDKADSSEQTISSAYVLAAEGVLEDQNTPLGPDTKILTHPKVFRKFRSDTAAQYVYPTPLSREKAKEIAGYDWVLSTLLKTNLTKSGFAHDGSLAHFIMGNFRDWLISEWGGFLLTKSDTAYNPINSTSGMFGRVVHTMGTMLYDGGVIRSESLMGSNNLNYT